MTTWPPVFETPRQQFLESLRVRAYAPGTLKSYAESLSCFFRFLTTVGMADLRDMTRETIRAYQQWLHEQPYTIWTRSARLQALRRFCEHLEATDQVFLNPCAGLILVQADRGLPRTVLTRAEARAILNAPDTQWPKGIRDRAILEVFYATGIRLEELTRLTVLDLDLRQGFVRIHRGKFAKDRVVPMGRQACDALRVYLTVRTRWTERQREERALWLSSIDPHRPIRAQVIQVLVRTYAKQAGVTRRITPHVWRHTCATHLVANGANLIAVQRLLGHRSLATTQRYSRVAIPELHQTFRRAHPRARLEPAS
ncbi:MAG: site-specific tyrosine recombinase XerD [Nitrospira sp. LK70]|nr:site-specific tyrosine recombinase XerD [Nitrospira sp. LK70]